MPAHPRTLLALLLAACAGGGSDIGLVKSRVDNDGDGYTADVDCDDAHATVNPDATEHCDGVDENCNDLVDDGAIDALTVYTDLDGDTYGDPATEALTCAEGDHLVAVAGDCDDNDASANPASAEVCDGVDNDCDGTIDDNPADPRLWYADSDDDAHGDPAISLSACEAPDGYVAAGDDCDDANPAIYPDAPEDDCTDPTDYNCDGSVAYADADGDGSPACEDCDDADPARSPAQVEVCDEADLDEDCSGAADDADPNTDAATQSDWHRDVDGDGYAPAGAASLRQCEAPIGYAALTGDCDDYDSGRNPGETEVCDASNTDEDCDGTADDADASVDPASWTTYHRDADADTYGDPTRTLLLCDAPSSYVANNTDCDDTDPARNPGEVEVCDAADKDEDCDSLADEADSSLTDAAVWYADGDSDGYGLSTHSTTACDQPAGYVANSTDCDDSRATVSPGDPERCDAANLDEDCDGLADDADSSVSGQSTWYRDADVDTYGLSTSTAAACDQPTGYVAAAGDCNDSAPAINPAAAELCDAANTDEDCDGLADDLDSAPTGTRTWYRDADADTYGLSTSAAATCDQPAGYVATAGDCNDGATAINPAAAEVCDAANTDEDCDGLADDLDSGATGQSTFYQDADSDSYGTSATTSLACDLPVGYATTAGDCDETRPTAYPGATETCGDGIDQDCDGADLACPPTVSATLPLGDVSADWISTRIEGGTSSMTLGQRPITVFDFDNDGYDDLLSVQAGTNGGAAYLHRGPLAGGLTASTTDADASVSAPSTAHVIQTVSRIGDHDGDGIEDFAVGNTGYDGATTNVGAIYIFSGALSGAVTAGSTYPMFVGESVSTGSFGMNIAPAGDTNDDGYDDLFAASSLAGTTSGRGKVYLLEGPFAAGSRAVATYATATFQGEASSNYLGTALIGDIDLNNDGEEDLVMGAYGYASNTGRVYVYYGPFSGSTTVSATGADVSITGATTGNYLGYITALAVIPDMNGDGYDELAVGAQGNDDVDVDTGKVYVFFGPSSGALNLSDADLTVSGLSPNDYCGWSVSGVEDMDGDGGGELLVGCIYYDYGAVSSTGVGLLYYSGAIGDLDVLDADFTLYGEDSADTLGTAVGPAGDFDDDGVPDFFVGAAADEYVGTVSTGIVYLVPGSLDILMLNAADATASPGTSFGYRVGAAGDFNHDGYDDAWLTSYGSKGSATLVLGPWSASETGDATITGDATNDYLGQAIDGGARFNTDAYDDSIVGAPLNDGNGTDAGEAYLITGRSTPISYAASTSAFAQYTGTTAGDQFGHSVTRVDDWDGDGIDDFAAGTPVYSGSYGRAWLVTGPFTGHSGVITTYADSTFTCGTVGSAFSQSLDGDGDLNGDGYADLAIGASGWDLPNTNNGAVYLYAGGANGTFTTATATASILGATTSDVFGSGVAIIGDFNKDGKDDLVVGSPNNDTTATNAGSLSLFFGPLSGSLSVSDADAVFYGQGSGEAIGYFIDGAGDLNRDGYADFAAGGTGSDLQFTNAGIVHVLYGNDLDLSSPFTWTGPTASTAVGPAAGVGDTNADGYDDLLIGGVGASTGYLLLGG